jgi:hypothetical protein
MTRIEIGDVVLTNTSLEGIVTSEEPRPKQSWLAAQYDERVRTLDASVRWLGVLPFSGGMVITPEPLTERLRRATVEDVRAAVEGANTHAVKTLIAVFPDEVRELLKKS